MRFRNYHDGDKAAVSISRLSGRNDISGEVFTVSKCNSCAYLVIGSLQLNDVFSTPVQKLSFRNVCNMSNIDKVQTILF